MEGVILLVEDEEKLARVAELELKYEGYRVEKALKYEEIVPKEEPEKTEQPWEVRFTDGGRGRPGQELSVERQFHWGKWDWYVPAVYACGKGLVADLLVRVSREERGAGTQMVCRRDGGGTGADRWKKALFHGVLG